MAATEAAQARMAAEVAVRKSILTVVMFVRVFVVVVSADVVDQARC